jgi:endo-1,4-beta-xylanase
MRKYSNGLPAAIALIALAACGGGGGGDTPPILGGGGGGGNGLPDPSTAPALKAIISARFAVDNFPVGAAIAPDQTTGATATLLQKHYSSITAENVMKPDTIWPNAAGSTTQPAAAPDFTAADQLVAFATTNGIKVRGHTLLWHQTAPSWFFAGDQTNPANYRAIVQQNLCHYIDVVMRHFAGANVYAWDLVNEVATDTPNSTTNPYRTNSPWYQAYSVGGMSGKEYVRDAFQCAGQTRAAMGRNASNLKLMLNDYNTELPGKRANVMAIVDELVAQSLPIDGVGHQFHLQLDADVTQVTAALTAVESRGLISHVTELDVSIYADPGDCYSTRTTPPCLADYGANPPATVLSQQAALYRALYNAFNRASVQSITTWGVADNHTWLNSFPVNRTNRPLLFDTGGSPKRAFWAVVDPTFTP